MPPGDSVIAGQDSICIYIWQSLFDPIPVGYSPVICSCKHISRIHSFSNDNRTRVEQASIMTVCCGEYEATNPCSYLWDVCKPKL